MCIKPSLHDVWNAQLCHLHQQTGLTSLDVTLTLINRDPIHVTTLSTRSE